jgi:hypothetical protein
MNTIVLEPPCHAELALPLDWLLKTEYAEDARGQAILEQIFFIHYI